MSEHHPSARGSAADMAATLVDMVQTRLDLAATELAQERLHWARQCVVVLITLWALAVGVVLVALALAPTSTTEHRTLVLALLGGFFVGIGAVAAWQWRARSRAKPGLLEATLGTLRADAAALRGADGAPASTAGTSL
jgi:uncharacterized membrane protein YqjE